MLKLENWYQIFTERCNWNRQHRDLHNLSCVAQATKILPPYLLQTLQSQPMCTGRPRCAGYWQAALGRQNFPYACLCLVHTDICATSDSSKSKRPALAKISCPSVVVSRDKWMEARWLSMESLHWSKLMIPDVPIEPHKGLYTCAIKSTTFCFEIGIRLIWFVKHGGKI